MHFGAALRIFRTDAGLSLRRLAEQVGVSNAYLSRVEHGHDAPPTPDRLAAIAKALGLPPSLLLELAQKINPSIAGYLERVPTAAPLFLEIARRGLGSAQLARVKAFIDAEFPTSRDFESRQPRLRALLSADRVVLGLSCSHLEDVIDIAATKLATAEGPDGRELASAILRREQESPTGFGDGIAAPHAIGRALTPRAALLTLARPLSAATPDGVPLWLFFVTVHPTGGQELLLILGQVARLAGSGLAPELASARSPEQALEQIETLYG